jgi:predicted TIM-barrel fold metal-dependent hydrolase
MIKKMKTSRRKFLTNTGLSAAGLMLGSTLSACSREQKSRPSFYDLMAEVNRYRKIDAHAHVGLHGDDADKQIDFADRLGIEKLSISHPITNYSGTEPEDPEEVRRSNDIILRAMKKYPDRFFGFLTLNPRYPKESLEEIDRCVDQGMIGYKGYIQVKFNDPLYYPIIEKFISLNMVMLMHAFVQLGVGGYRMKYDIGRFPHTTLPEDMVDIATRYPEGLFQYAHIGGGGDWEYACKMFKDYPNIYVDTAGSNNEENMINFAMNYLGEDRILFGCDGSFYQGVGKICAAELSESRKEKIFFENYNNLLKKSGNHVG